MAEEEGAEKRPQFGSRYLTDEKNVFQHNAWDNVQWDEEQEQEALVKVKQHSECLMSADEQELLSTQAAEKWDSFYGIHQNRFFKDRHWLFTEFPELSKPTCQDDSEGSDVRTEINLEYPGSHAKTTIFEVGCGVGNTVFPILEANNDNGLFVYCCDFSTTAVNLVREHESYDPARCHAFECDLSDMESTMPFPDNSMDIITMIFVLSAIKPDRMQAALNRLARLLKPGGRILFRDYGRYDLAQLRFKQGRCLQDNFYARGDGTLVYFFTQDEMRDKLTTAGLVEESNLVDRRLQVNRGRQLKMYRVWIQCKYRKPNLENS